MRRQTPVSSLLAILFLALALPWAAAQAQGQVKRLVVFGDSLSDPGNAFALLGESSTPPDYSVDPFLVPDRPYSRGGHHFSNGATWVEQLARPLGLAASARPAFRGAGGSNFAIGGARARVDGTQVDLSSQVSAFLDASGQSAPPDALYVIEIGGNDLRDALAAFVQALQTGATPAQAQAAAGAVITDAVSSVGARMLTLAAAGAQQFLVWRVPDIGATPAVRGLGAQAQGVASALTQAFNDALEAQVLAPLEAGGLRIVRLDVYGRVNQIIASPADFGLTNVTSACITPSVAPFQCRTPDDFLFWDGIHPTAAGHAIIAQQAASALSH